MIKQNKNYANKISRVSRDLLLDSVCRTSHLLIQSLVKLDSVRRTPNWRVSCCCREHAHCRGRAVVLIDNVTYIVNIECILGPNPTMHLFGPQTIHMQSVKLMKWMVLEICEPQTDRETNYGITTVDRLIKLNLNWQRRCYFSDSNFAFLRVLINNSWIHGSNVYFIRVKKLTMILL